jgi:hypothetical protein
MSPLQQELHTAHKARQYRFINAAVQKKQQEHLTRQREAWNQRRAEQKQSQKEEERLALLVEQAAPEPTSHNRPAFPIRKELLLQTLESHGVGLDELMSPRRLLKLVAARQELYARLKMFTRMSYPQIGRFCGDRDHTTIMHGVRKYADMRAQAARLSA